MLEHQPVDYVAGISHGGALQPRRYPHPEFVGCACCAHAVTNALLGGYVMHSQQWGFW